MYPFFYLSPRQSIRQGHQSNSFRTFDTLHRFEKSVLGQVFFQTTVHTLNIAINRSNNLVYFHDTSFVLELNTTFGRRPQSTRMSIDGYFDEDRFASSSSVTEVFISWYETREKVSHQSDDHTPDIPFANKLSDARL